MQRKKSTVKLLAVMMLAILSIAALTACGAKTLEEKINSDKDTKKQIEQLETSGVSIDVKGNTLTYTYKFPSTYTDEQIKTMKSSLDTALESNKSQFEGVAKSLEDSTDIKGIKVKVVYQDKDKKEIASKTYESA